MGRASGSHPFCYGALLLLGVGITVCCLWWDRISIHEMIVSDTAKNLIESIFLPFERVLGVIPVDAGETNEQVKIANLFRGLIPAYAFYLVAIFVVIRLLKPNDPDGLRITLLFAVTFRLVLFPFPPILETDIHRYLWDGAVLSNGGNPYQFAPVEFTKIEADGHREFYSEEEWTVLSRLDSPRRHPRMIEHFKRINHPTIPTIYPPMTQVVFATAHLISPASQESYKLLNALIDLGIVWILLVLLGALGMNRNWILLYAWSPLILKEYTNTGHHDPIATLMTLIGLYLLLVRPRSPLPAAVALGLAALGKLYPLVIALALARRLRIRGLLVTAAVFALGYAPFIASTGWRTFDGLTAFAKRWEFNSSIYAASTKVYEFVGFKSLPVQVPDWVSRIPFLESIPNEIMLDDRVLAKITVSFAMALLLGFLAWLPLQVPRQIVGHAFAVVAAIFLLSPVSDPWYLGWVMPYVTLIPMASWVYLSGSVFIYYLYFWSWSYLPDARAIEYLPFYTLLIVEILGRLPYWLAARRTPGIKYEQMWPDRGPAGLDSPRGE